MLPLTSDSYAWADGEDEFFKIPGSEDTHFNTYRKIALWRVPLISFFH